MSEEGKPRRWLRRSIAVLVILVLVGWLGTAAYFAITADAPFLMVAALIPAGIWCGVVGCPVEASEGVSVALFDDRLIASVPVALDADAWGRLYVAESDRVWAGAEDNRFRGFWLEDDLASTSVSERRAYIEKWLAAGEFDDPDHFRSRSDKVVRLTDEDGDGTADRREELSSHNDIVDGPGAGILVEGRDLWYTNIPNLWHLRDSDDDGKAEVRDVLHTGFGVKTSLLGHDMHGLVWGPDGRIYFSIGDRGYQVTNLEGERFVPTLGPGRGAVFRMNPDGSALERFAEGVRNPQELAFDDYGNLFTGDNNGDGGDEARIVYVVEGGDTGWAMPYQTLVDPYIRGPWVAERLWETYHETQPAWIVPPVAYLARGPAGFAAYPGTGLPERYAGHFFLADYRYIASQSGIWSFGIEPKGAGFEIVDEHEFLWSVLATDVDFGLDGRIWVSAFDQIRQSQSIHVARHDEAAADPRVAEVARLVQEGFEARPVAELRSLLAHADRRVRQRAQWELVRRGESDALASMLRSSEAPLLARIHAVWGLGQMGGRHVDAALASDPGFLSEADTELRAQVAKVAGDAKAAGLTDALLGWLSDDAPRVRFFAAQSLGALGEARALAPLVSLLRENDDEDPFLRHAAVYALHRLGELERLIAHRDDPSRAVRLGVLLNLRRAQDARVAHFLSDADPLLVVEAARAIYDVPIRAAFGALGALAGDAIPLRDDDPQTSHALHRRIIGANLALGSEASALALAAYAADERNPREMRMLALDSLEAFTEPGPRDLAMSWYRPLPAREPDVVFAALDTWGPELVKGELGDRALEVALSHGRVPLDDAELMAKLSDAGAAVEGRVASLQALASRGSDATGAALDAALASDAALLRAAARDVLVDRDPAAALAAFAELEDAAPVPEWQSAFASLARLPGEEADAMLASALDELIAGRLPVELQLDALSAARSRSSERLQAQLAEWEETFAADDLIGPRQVALAGGDAARGRTLYQTKGDCLRCHAGGAGHGAGVGPDLSGVVARRGRPHVLESVILPQSEIAEGFATLSVTRRDGSVVAGNFVAEDAAKLTLRVGGEDVVLPLSEIASRTPTVSGMPPMGLSLTLAELRDLMAYVDTL